MSKKLHASKVVQIHPSPEWMDEPSVWRMSEPDGEQVECRGTLRRWLRRSLDVLINDLTRLRSRL